jgi:hypothetical protein
MNGEHEPELLVRFRSTRNTTYHEFQDCRDMSKRYEFIDYQPTLTETTKRLLEPTESTFVLECAFPMAMALVCLHEEVRIVGFLDMAQIQERGSLRIYHLASLSPGLSGPVRLYVESPHSMPAVVAIDYLEARGIRWEAVEVLAGFDALIDTVVALPALEGVVWVLDEGLGDEGTLAKPKRHNLLVSKLGSRFSAMSVKNGWEEFFKGKPDYIQVPGMVLVANRPQLPDRAARDIVHGFLSNWSEFSRNRRHPRASKTFGPVSWDQFQELWDFIDLSATVYKVAGRFLGIKRPLRMSSDFFDPTPPADKEGR